MKKIYRKIIYFFFFFLYGKVLSKKINKKKFKNKILIKKLPYKSGPISKLYIIKKGRIFTDCNTNVAYISENKIIPQISYQQNKDTISSVKFNSTLKHGTPKFKKYLNGKVFSLVQGASGNNYWHWLFDILPKIEILHQNKYLKKINYFYIPNINNFVLETCKIFGIKESQLINSQRYKHIHADEIYAFEHLYLKKGMFQKQFKNIPVWITNFLNKKFLKFKKKFKCSNKVYIDRSDSKFSHFKIYNQKSIIEYLRKKGFKTYKLSKLNIFKQIYLFNSAKVILGLHGAGFANLSFCKPKTKVYEILTKKESDRLAVKTICKHLKIKHTKIITSSGKNQKNSLFNVFVDLNKIKKIF